MSQKRADLPRVEVEQVARTAGQAAGNWWVTWRIRNAGVEPLGLVDSYLPHGKFRGPRVDLTAANGLPRGSDRELCLPVVFEEPPGAAVENTFLILTVLWQEAPWRILVRMTVRADSGGAPTARTELVTVQRVGFSAA